MNIKNTCKILSIFLICIQLGSLIITTQANHEEYKKFIVTAYYSPLPNQEFYLTGDYEREKRLNGQGIAGASGKPVFSGMLAAPGNYSFGTKIELEGVGIGAVEDRGGAIVPAGNRGYQHDRIDIWVGYGDEGLRRALYWGKRTINGRIVSNTQTTDINIESLSAPKWVTANIPSQRNAPGVMFQSTTTSQEITSTHHSQVIPSTQIPDLYLTSMGRESSGELVKELQDILIVLGYLNDETKTGIYDKDTISAIFKLQQEFDIVQKSTDTGAGYFGPSTRAKIKDLYDSYLEDIEKEKRYHAMIDTLLEEAGNTATSEIEALGSPQLGDISPHVRTLQILLRELGYFDRADTAIFGPLTREAIITLQVDKEIIISKDDTGAGIFGPRTREAVIEELTRIHFQRLLESHEIYEEFILRKQNHTQST